ncbi:MAG: hypothetical protein ACJ8F4_10105 [Sphingomonas sp.]
MSAASDVARNIHEQLASEYERLIEDATHGRVTFLRSQLENGSPTVRMIGSPAQR